MSPTLASVLLVAGWLPMLIGIAKRRASTRAPDANAAAPPADRVLLGATWVLCMALTAVAALDVQQTAPGTRRVPAGVALFVLAMIAWVWGRGALGDEFAQLPRVPRALVTAGPYRFVRHPLYLSTAAGTFGHALAAGTVRAAALWLALTVVLGVRARREDRLLGSQFPTRPRDPASTADPPT